MKWHQLNGVDFILCFISLHEKSQTGSFVNKDCKRCQYLIFLNNTVFNYIYYTGHHWVCSNVIVFFFSSLSWLATFYYCWWLKKIKKLFFFLHFFLISPFLWLPIFCLAVHAKTIYFYQHCTIVEVHNSLHHHGVLWKLITFPCNIRSDSNHFFILQYVFFLYFFYFFITSYRAKLANQGQACQTISL